MPGAARSHPCRSVVVAWLGVALAAGCAAGTPEPLAPELARQPAWTVGDRWVFVRTTVAGVVRVVTHEVAAATPAGYTMRVSGLGMDIMRSWTRDFHFAGQNAGGAALTRFEPAARYFTWPLALGAEWTQAFEYRDGRNDGRYVNHWRVAERLVPV
ncbi:MAG: hypothetical protein ACREKS_01015, partial [Candidatus Rokuibacteriota bacterium]